MDMGMGWDGLGLGLGLRVFSYLRGVFVDHLGDPPGQALVDLARLQAELAPPGHLHLTTERRPQREGRREREQGGEA